MRFQNRRLVRRRRNVNGQRGNNRQGFRNPMRAMGNRQLTNYVQGNKRLTMYNLTRANRQLPYAERYQTTFTSTLVGVYPAGSTFYNSQVKANSINLPWNTVSAFPDPSAGYLTTTLQPLGKSQLLSDAGPYSSCLVKACKIRVTLQPSGANDSLYMSVVPWSTNETSPGEVIRAGQMPYGKGPIIVTGNNNVAKNTLKCYIASNKLFGVTPVKLQSEDGYSMVTNADPIKLMIFSVLLSNITDGVQTNPIAYSVKVKWYCDLYDYAGGDAPLT